MAMRITRSSRASERPLALLDIGSSKVCCLIVAAPSHAAGTASVGAPLPVRRLGFGLTQSRGIRAGAIVDIAQAEEAVRDAVADAEEEAGTTVADVVVSIGTSQLTSLNFSAGTKPATGTVTSADIDKVLEAGSQFAARESRELLHLHRLGFRLDGQPGLRNPRGLPGERLAIDLNAVTVDATAARNLRSLLGRGYLTATQMVAAPYASALACLAEDDLQSSTAVIDMGAGGTTFAVFAEGRFLHAGSIALGGQQITQDIARGLSLSVNQAERIKALYGNLAGAQSDEHEYVPITQAAGDPGAEGHVTRAQLRRMIAPRIEETLQLVRDRMSAGGLGKRAAGRVLLTGGASQLAGLAEVASRQLGGSVRVASPLGLAGFAAGELTPAMGVVVGLGYAVLVPGALPKRTTDTAQSSASYVGRLSRWFKDSFWDEETAAGNGAT